MEIDFLIGGTPAKPSRGWFFGGMKLTTPKASIWLQQAASLVAT